MNLLKSNRTQSENGLFSQSGAARSKCMLNGMESLENREMFSGTPLDATIEPVPGVANPGPPAISVPIVPSPKNPDTRFEVKPDKVLDGKWKTELVIPFDHLFRNDELPQDARIVNSASFATKRGSVRTTPNAFVYTHHASPELEAERFHFFDGFRYFVEASNQFGRQVQNNAYVSIRINDVPNLNPVAVSDTLTVDSGERAWISNSRLLRNDSDPEETPLKIIDVFATDDTKGFVQKTTRGAYYSSPDDFVGTDRFLYKFEDQDGGVSIGIVQVNVLEPVQRPNFGARSDHYEVNRGETNAISLLENDWGDGITFDQFIGDTGGITLEPNGEPGSGEFLLTVNEGADDFTPFSYKISDATGRFAVAAVTVEVPTEIAEQPTIGSAVFNDGVLSIRGTADVDNIQVSQGKHAIRVFNHGQELGSFYDDDVKRIAVFAKDGDDIVNLQGVDIPSIIRGGDGNDRLIGGSADDTILGRKGRDQLIGGPGNDRLIGGRGRDWFDGGAGKDTTDAKRREKQSRAEPGLAVRSLAVATADDVDAGDGSILPSWLTMSGTGITITGSPGDDTIIIDSDSGYDVVVRYSNGKISEEVGLNGVSSVGVRALAGNDRIVNNVSLLAELRGGPGNDHIDGGPGIDAIFGGSGNDLLYGNDGEDMIYGEAGDDWLNGGNGNDFLDGAAGNDGLYGSNGDDRLYGGAGKDTVKGRAGNDLVVGGLGADRLFGGDGDDDMQGQDGDDEMHGGDGNDTMNGGYGHDTIHGDNGDDFIDGRDGNDLLYGWDGNDVIYGGSGRDWLNGGNGHDTLYGQSGDDGLFGSNGNDRLYGGRGHDNLMGRSGNDSLFGGSGNDTMRGGEGDDLVDGEDGNDTLFGGLGSDTLYGRRGRDRLVSRDKIAGNDRLFGGLGDDEFDAPRTEIKGS